MAQIDNFQWIRNGMEVWVSDKESTEIFYRGIVKKIGQNTQNVLIQPISSQRYSEQAEIELDSQLLDLMNSKQFQGKYTDMVNMENLNEAELLFNIKNRFQNNQIFTYIGPTLLAINPYKEISSIFNANIMKQYQLQSLNDGFSLNDMEPHIFAMAGLAFRQLFQKKKNQSLVISGESGAGKTEETKLAMSFLTSLQAKTQNSQNQSRRRSSLMIPGQTKQIEQQILGCNPILEAFGNAKTMRNDNSSRFGKLVLLLIDIESFKIKGAVITNYLLEKSRVNAQPIGERNYHIFYQLLRGGESNLLSKLKLKDMFHYNYLKQSKCFEIKTIDDVACYNELIMCLQIMKFEEQEIDSIWKIIASILHLGNIEYDDSKQTSQDPCEIKQSEILQFVSEFLQIDEKILKQNLLYKTRKIGDQEIISSYTKADCITIRDTFTKALYERLFNWLVKKLNQAISTAEYKNIPFEQIINDKSRLSIGLLDIFGFEVFKINSLEQLCINFANEKLQQLYIHYVFKQEKNEFIQEGLKDHLNQINVRDNQPILDLLDFYPSGIFNLLDEASIINSKDELFMQNIVKNHQKNINLVIPKLSKTSFIVCHTAKDVEYEVNGFKDKNKDEISLDIVKMMIGSQNITINLLFQGVISQDELTQKLKQEEELSSKKSSQKDKFIGGKLRLQIKDLMAELHQSDCHFIRCLKPNEQKQKDLFVDKLVLQQIQYLGVLETIKIRQESYSVRKQYRNFYQYYYEIDQLSYTKSFSQLELTNPDFKQLSKDMIQNLNLENIHDIILFGKTKVFMKTQGYSIIC